MVCEKCEKKYAVKGGTLATPEVWKAGSRETKYGGRAASNTLLTKKTARSSEPYETKCKLCKAKLHQFGYYCSTCAYKKGICSMCGIKILDTTMYRQTTR